MPDRRWNLADTELVARSHSLSDGQLAALLPKRRIAEAGRLRETLHGYHGPRAKGVLLDYSDNTAMLLIRLKGQVTCARCGAGY